MHTKIFKKVFIKTIERIVLSQSFRSKYFLLLFVSLIPSVPRASDCEKKLLLPFLSLSQANPDNPSKNFYSQSIKSFSKLAEQISQGLLLNEDQWEVFSSYVVFHFQDSKRDAPEDISPHTWDNLLALVPDKSLWIRPSHKEFIIRGPSSYFYNIYPLSIQTEQSLRIRPLSAQEIPYREYLGPTPIHLRYNPYTFIDPRLVFFTLTTTHHTSHGIVTIGLGESLFTENNIPFKKKTALLLGIEDIPQEFISGVIEGIRQSLENSGYALALPNPKGPYIFSENAETQRSIKLKIVSQAIKHGQAFQLHPEFKPQKTPLRSDFFSWSDIKFISPLPVEPNLLLQPGNTFQSHFNKNIFDLDTLIHTAQYSPEDPPEKIRDFIIYSSQFEKMEYFQLSDFDEINHNLSLIIQNKKLSDELRILAFFSLTLNEPEFFLYNLKSLEPKLQFLVLNEIKNWVTSKNEEKQNFIYILSQTFPTHLKTNPNLKEIIKRIIEFKIIRPDLYFTNKNKKPIALIHYYIKMLPFDLLYYLIQIYRDWIPPHTTSNNTSSYLFSVLNNEGDSAWTKILLLIAEKNKLETHNILPLNFMYVEQMNQDGNQILHLAALHGATELIHWLIEAFPNISINQVNFHRKTPLQIAIENGHLETAEVLSFELTHQLLGKFQTDR